MLGKQEFFIKLDVPYIFNTKWRLRVEGGYEANPNLLFFGLTPQETLQGLKYYNGTDTVRNVRYSDYEKNFLSWTLIFLMIVIIGCGYFFFKLWKQYKEELYWEDKQIGQESKWKLISTWIND